MAIAGYLHGAVLGAGNDPLPLRDDFENDALGAVPDAWFVPPAVAEQGTTAEVTDEQPAEGARCVRIVKQGREAFGNLMRSFDGTPYRGLRIRFAASVRTEAAAAGSRAQLWMRVDRSSGGVGFFDNMFDRPILSTEWRRYEIVGDVDRDARLINLGIMQNGPGTAWVDDVIFEVIGDAAAAAEPARPLTERGLANLIAFARLLGYVRHFHPSDEAADTDWDRFAVRGVHVVEEAADAEDLAARLEALVGPIAPAVDVATRRPVESSSEPGANVEGFTLWEHRGFAQHLGGSTPRSSIYRSWRQRALLEAADPDHAPMRPGEAIVRELGGGVWCRVPICLYYDDQGTLPAAEPRKPDEGGAFDWNPPQGWYPTGHDRGTRLAAVLLAWNVFQHFYPYFDVVQTNWDAALGEALRSAAEDRDADDFVLTLRRLVAHVHDGHGRVAPPRGARLPFELDWIDGKLVVTAVHAVDGVGPTPGDVVISIDGTSTEESWRELEPLISGATEQWKRYRALGEISARDAEEPFTAELLKPDGRRYSIRARPTAASPGLGEPRPDKIAEVAPGIWYLDMNRISDADFTAALGDLTAASGVIFDLRGYPNKISTIVIAHLIDEPVTSAQWHVPIVRRPDRQGMTFDFSNWKVFPQKPRLKAPVAFLTDGRAISAAETHMGIIEHYELAEIVGSATAGTNGNVNAIRLPGGTMITFTGMKVLKHDGSRHHGVGIQPTVPVERTIAGVAAGRDELLEKAIEVVGGSGRS